MQQTVLPSQNDLQTSLEQAIASLKRFITQSADVVQQSSSIEIDPPLQLPNREWVELEAKLTKLKDLLLQKYTAATNAEKTKISHFVNQFSLVVRNLNNPRGNINLQAQLNSVNQAARACSTYSEVAEPGISWVAYVLGGLVGLLVGAVVGAIVGPLYILVNVISSTNGTAVIDPIFLIKISFIIGAPIGAALGAAWGAVEFSKSFHACTQRFFKPFPTIDDITKPIFEAAKLKQAMEKDKIATAIKGVTNPPFAPPELINIMAEYAVRPIDEAKPAVEPVAFARP